MLFFLFYGSNMSIREATFHFSDLALQEIPQMIHFDFFLDL